MKLETDVDPSPESSEESPHFDQNPTALVGSDWSPNTEFLKRVVAEVKAAIREVDPDAETTGRVKSSKSTSEKEHRFTADLRAIHDKVGVRVIVGNSAQCFSVIERLHEEMPHLEQLYDDYITHPKPNGYQSLHSTVLAENGWPFEVQVRTREMHERSESGAAAHHLYKDLLLSDGAPKSSTRPRRRPRVDAPELGPADGKSTALEHQPKVDCLGIKVAFVSTYPPVACSVASYTAELTQAIQNVCPSTNCIVLTVNRPIGAHRYAEQIHYQITTDSIGAYRDAARFLNLGDFRLLSLQHDYEIFGGPQGAHILALMREARPPIVTTLHTVSKNPTLVRRAIMNEVCALSEKLVVSSARAAELLVTQHDVPTDKIATIGLRRLELDGALFEREPPTQTFIDWPTVATKYLQTFNRALGYPAGGARLELAALDSTPNDHM